MPEIENTPLPSLHPKLKQLFDLAIERQATDIHLSAGHSPILRVDGSLVAIDSEKILNQEEVKTLAFSILNQQMQEKFSAYKDLDLSYAYENKARFRISIYQQLGKASAAFRLIPSRIRTLEELSLPQTLRGFTKMAQGFFLVVGPSGHGKSAALAAMIEEINVNRYDHIITIEDPIEYLFEQKNCIIDQREVGMDVQDFHRGLRAMFREDADVVMVGEMRDPETISTAITAAETGHLIFSTLHTNTAAQTIDRIIDTFPPHQQEQIKMQVANTLLGVLSRRLIPKKGGGVINAVELMIANSAIRNLIREGKAHQIDMVIETGQEQGMISLNRSLADLVQRDLITYENAEIFSTNPSELRMML